MPCLAIYYVKEWCTCTSAADAPINDLAFYKKLLLDLAKVKKTLAKFPTMFLEFLDAAQDNLQALMVPFRTPCYHSNLQQSNAPKLSEKVKIWKALKK